MKPIIKIENLSKQYRIGERKAPYETLSDTLAEVIRSPFKNLRRKEHSKYETIWALKDVSFDVYPGEIVGIIGHNGAGKTTILKILSRITEPTTGRVEFYGRVTSLLGVGTGFHSELSGRENIYLNGAILGMTRAETGRKFDEIVAFAGVEKFVDTPVKYYSSGMFMRLAFAVAAHLEPEILLVDEVLAAGDAAFQKKSQEKLSGMAREGRAVIFVSHSFEAVKSLCTRCLLLDQGRIVEDNKPEVTTQRALAQLKVETPPTIKARVSPTTFVLQTIRDVPAIPQPVAVKAKALGKLPDEPITVEDDIVVTLQLDSPIQEGHTFGFSVFTSTGTHVFNSLYHDDGSNPPLQPDTTSTVHVAIPRGLLPGGLYEGVFTYMLPNTGLFWRTRDTWFEVHEAESHRGNGVMTKREGLVSVVLPWKAS